MHRILAAISAFCVIAFTLVSTASAQAPEVKRPKARVPYVQATYREDLNANTVTVISGNPNGTYLAVAFDMTDVLDNGNDLRVLAMIGKGGAQNVRDILHLRGVDMGITQANVMRQFKRTGEVGPNLDQRLVYICKLYNEEMHILAGPGINSIKDLDGKVVNFSDVGSGTQFSTRLIFELLSINAKEVNMSQGEGYQKVKSGEIAATILIAGKPTGAFSKFKLEAGMKILPVAYSKELEQDYLPAALTHEDYPNIIPQGQQIETIAVGSVLAVYNWPKDTERYRRVAKFVNTFFDRIQEFQKPPRHRKWRETNLSATLPGWTRFPAAQEWLDRAAAATPAAPASVDAGLARIQAARAAPSDPAEQERLFKQFLEWSKAQKKQ